MVAVGAEPASGIEKVPGAKERAIPFYSIEDSYRVKQAIRELKVTQYTDEINVLVQSVQPLLTEAAVSTASTDRSYQCAALTCVSLVLLRKSSHTKCEYLYHQKVGTILKWTGCTVVCRVKGA